jgi:hypothetical protein
MRQWLVVLVAALTLVSCVTGDEPAGDPSDYDAVEWSGADGKGDFSGVPAVFDRHHIMSDAVMTTSTAVDATALQEFFENSPYGGRSWLADHMIDGKRFSDVLAEESRAGGIDPVVLLARMQVESSLVSATSRPSNTKINHALGCGCPDRSGCSASYAGLRNQLRCATEVLSERFAESVSGEGAWELNKSKRTLDPLAVTPRSHATAALYAYTPWVLVGRGGNWLVWNVTRKYLKHFDEAGTLHLP